MPAILILISKVMANVTETRYFLLQKRQSDDSYLRHFPPLEENVLIKVLLGAILEQCITDRLENDVDYLLNYILVLRGKLQDRKYYDIEVIGTEAFKE